MSNLTEHEYNDRIAFAVSDEIELEEYVAPPDRKHHDHYAQFTHELSEDAADASTRGLVRVVPLVYAALLGGLADNLVLGLSAGLALSMVFDLAMGGHSMVRALSRSMHRLACPTLSRAARWLVRGIARLRLSVPPSLANLQCDNSRS